MGFEHWIVKTPSGEEWGLLKRLIIDSATRQISYADVILRDTGRLVRLPCGSLEVQDDWITLRVPEEKATRQVMRASG